MGALLGLSSGLNPTPPSALYNQISSGIVEIQTAIPTTDSASVKASYRLGAKWSVPQKAINAYIASLYDPTIIVYFYFFPQYVSESKSANYASINILGRSEPLRGYESSNPRMVRFTAWFHADNDPEIEVLDNINRLRSFLYPDYTSQATRTPPPVLLNLGDWINMQGIIEEINVRYGAPYSVIDGSFVPHVAQVDIAVSETAVIPWGTNDVKDGKDKASLKSSLRIITNTTQPNPSVPRPSLPALSRG